MTEQSERATEQEAGLRQKASMTHWWPRLEDLCIPTPDTIKIGTEDREIDDGAPSTDNTTIVQTASIEEMRDATRELGGPPAFIRSDQMSAKHQRDYPSKITSLDFDALSLNAWDLFEQHMMAWGVPDAECYYVREWLDLYHEFKAFGGIPIAAELRFFIYEGEVWDAGFYWPSDAIRRPKTEDWETAWEMTEETAWEYYDAAEEQAKVVATEFDSYWSVDFALTFDHDWYCIDMAPGELSWHPDSVTPPEEVDR